MSDFHTEIQVRWADLDPNVHLRHSVYYDWGALCRIEFFMKYGLSMKEMNALNVGPILFREECVFRKEVHYGDKVRINLKVSKARRDYSRWSIQHEIIKGEDTRAAVLTVDGAWLNLKERKLAAVPPQVLEVFEKAAKTPDFLWLD